MKITCSIIRDLLPLYAEDMVSPDSRELVDDHLCGCDECTKELAALKKRQPIPVETDVSSLKRVELTIRRKKTMTVLAVLMTVAALIVTGMTWLFTPYTLTKTEAIEGVWVTEDGALAIDYARGITGKASQSVLDSDNVAHICNTTRYDWYMGRQKDEMLEAMTEEEIRAYIAELYKKEECTETDWNRFFDIDVDYGVFQTLDGEYLHRYDPETWTEENGKWTNRPVDRNLWYIHPTNTGMDMYLMHDAGLEMPDSVLWLTSNAYGYLLFGCLGFAALFFWISRGITGIWKEVLSRVAMILVCVAASTLLVTGGRLKILEYHLTYEWNRAIYMESLVLSLAALLWHQLHRMNRTPEMASP